MKSSSWARTNDRFFPKLICILENNNPDSTYLEVPFSLNKFREFHAVAVFKKKLQYKLQKSFQSSLFTHWQHPGKFYGWREVLTIVATVKSWFN